MKQEIIDIILSNDPLVEKFNQLFKIYNNHPAKNMRLVFMFNRSHPDKISLGKLILELRRLEKITDVDLFIAEKNAKQAEKAKSDNPETIIVTQQHLDDNPELAENGIKVGDVIEVGTIEDAQPAEEKSEEPKFREDYPFLNNPDIPNEFKILAADKITAYKNLMIARETLQKAADSETELSQEELAELTKQAAEADELNSLIHEEFEHYQNTGEVLGKHPIFTETLLMKKLDKMTGPEKLKRFGNLEKDINREKGKLKKAEEANDQEEVEKISARLKTKEIELALLRKLTQ